jgi:hypothetical protein
MRRRPIGLRTVVPLTSSYSRCRSFQALADVMDGPRGFRAVFT